MSKKYLILFLVLILVNSGCNSPKFYNEINSLYNKGNTIKNYNKKDINKELFKKIQNKLIKSNHIIYYYQPNFSISDNNFTSIVFDVDNKVFFYIKGININNIIIDTIPNSAYSKYQLDNINLYLSNQKNKLTDKGEDCDYSGVNVYDNIYEINLLKKVKNKFYFKNYFYCKDNNVDIKE